MVTIWTVILGVAFAFFKIQNSIRSIRADEADEIAGMDLPEMGVLAYPEFNGSFSGVSGTTASPADRTTSTGVFTS